LLEGYQHKEIAQLLDISESTSKTQYRRAKQLLRQRLKSPYVP
ncbi:MAG: sigma factor-like helix-turn-helix DNA-binding protein, partial [Bacteroidota bacterium]